MNDSITITGQAGSQPQQRTMPSGKELVSFRLASTTRRYDPQQRSWVDGQTNWFSICAWGALGQHVLASIQSGDPVIVQGKLRISEWHSGDKHGTNVDVDADAIGHSLQFGTTTYTKRARATQSAPLAREEGERERVAEPAGAPAGQQDWHSVEADPPF